MRQKGFARVVDVEDDFEVEIVQGIDLLGGVVEGVRVEFERNRGRLFQPLVQ